MGNVNLLLGPNNLHSNAIIDMSDINEAPGRHIIVFALILSTVWHFLFFMLYTIIQLLSPERPNPDLHSANKPTITIQLISAEQGQVKNTAASTQQKGVIKSRQFVKKNSAPDKAEKPATSNVLTSKSTIQYSKEVTRRKQFKYSQLKLRKQKQINTSATITSSAASEGGDRPPVYRLGSANNPRPPYPYLARKRGWQGRVILSVHVNPEGFATKVIIKQGSGHLILDRTARSTIAKWKFIPSLRRGKKVTAIIPVPVRFKLF